MPKVKMVLMGGEKDGLDFHLNPADIPQVFYAVPSPGEIEIARTRGVDAKRETRDRLAVLAYRYHPESSTTEVFRMVRTPELDKMTQPEP